MLLRITSPDELARLPIGDDGDGFVHLSRPDQVLTPANAIYSGRRDLLLLALDRAMLCDIRVEGGFPHLYGPLERDAIAATVGFPCDADGEFRLALVPVHAAEPPARDLIAAMVEELVPLYGRIDLGTVPSATPEDMWGPGGTFLVGWDAGGEPVCGGGVKRLDERTAEIKRMFVVPSARGRGHARRLLAGLEDAARRLGYSHVRLDTGPKQPHALTLYRSAGYAEIPDYNANPHAVYWAEKPLH